MLMIDPQVRYADVMERQIYNSILSGIGLDGASWFYSNVLRWYGKDHRLLSNDAHQRFQPGDPERRRANICCPTNVLRTVAEWQNCQYTTSDDGLWVHHYAANSLGAGAWQLALDTDYPWDGEITIELQAAPAEQSAILFRIPAWADGASITVNGEPTGVAAEPCM